MAPVRTDVKLATLPPNPLTRAVGSGGYILQLSLVQEVTFHFSKALQSWEMGEGGAVGAKGKEGGLHAEQSMGGLLPVEPPFSNGNSWQSGREKPDGVEKVEGEEEGETFCQEIPNSTSWRSKSSDWTCNMSDPKPQKRGCV